MLQDECFLVSESGVEVKIVLRLSKHALDLISILIHHEIILGHWNSGYGGGWLLKSYFLLADIGYLSNLIFLTHVHVYILLRLLSFASEDILEIFHRTIFNFWLDL